MKKIKNLLEEIALIFDIDTSGPFKVSALVKPETAAK